MSGSFHDRPHCPACAETQATEVYRCPYDRDPVAHYLASAYSTIGGVEMDHLQGVDYLLLQCAACGTVWQRYAPTGATAEALYERWIDPVLARQRFHRDRPLGERMLMVRELAMAVAWLGGIPERTTFLDLGAGWGEWCQAARGLGCPVTATELSPSRRRHLDQEGFPEPAPGSLHHLVNLEQVLEHLPDPAAMLVQARDSLAPAGLLRAVVPNARDINRRLRRMDWHAPKGTRWSLNLLAPLEHVNAFTPQGFLALANRCGLNRADLPLGAWVRQAWDPGRPFRSLLAWAYYRSPWTTHRYLRHS